MPYYTRAPVRADAPRRRAGKPARGARPASRAACERRRSGRRLRRVGRHLGRHPDRRFAAEERPGGGRWVAYVFVKPAPAGTTPRGRRLQRFSAARAAHRTIAISGDTIAVGAADAKVGANAARARYCVREAALGLEGCARDRGADGLGRPGGLPVGRRRGHGRRHDRCRRPGMRARPRTGRRIRIREARHRVGRAGPRSRGCTRATAPRADELPARPWRSRRHIVAAHISHNVGENEDQGAAYVYAEPARDGRTRQTSELTASDGGAGDKLGRRSRSRATWWPWVHHGTRWASPRGRGLPTCSPARRSDGRWSPTPTRPPS